MYSLFLYPVQPLNSETSASAVADWLAEADIINKRANTNLHPAGSRLMEFVNFLGCSPVVADGSADSAVLIHRFNQSAGLGGDSIVALRFPHCGHVIESPVPLIARYPSSNRWICPDCGNTGLVTDINWRKSAGFADCFIEISGIFPKEALPGDDLLALLKKASDIDWFWFYSKSSDAITADL